MSNNGGLTIDFIEKYIDATWNWKALSRGNFIEEYIHKPWNWDFIGLSKNSAAILDFGLSSNPNIAMDFIEKYSKKIYSSLGYNARLTPFSVFVRYDIFTEFLILLFF